MQPPANLKELRRFLGMVNQLAKFTPNLAEISQPLRELLSKRTTWCWDTAQESSFGLIKQELIRPPVLALYNLTAETKISADASSHGLGAVLLQRSTSSNVWKPIAFASRAMSETEKRYAQIEKEALATTWACEKFSEYIVGRKILIETDHKPLVPLFSMKTLDRLPPRILRFRLRLMRFQYAIVHVPGKHLYTADTLSRAPSSRIDTSDLLQQTEFFVNAVIQELPTTTKQLSTYQAAQEQDPICVTVMTYVRDGWPEKLDDKSMS